jgi:hypothetical protein
MNKKLKSSATRIIFILFLKANQKKLEFAENENDAISYAYSSLQ